MSASPLIGSGETCEFCTRGFEPTGTLREQQCTSFAERLACRGCCVSEGFVCDVCDDLFTAAEQAARAQNPDRAARVDQLTAAAHKIPVPTPQVASDVHPNGTGVAPSRSIEAPVPASSDAA